jgi:hypothetical protein
MIIISTTAMIMASAVTSTAVNMDMVDIRTVAMLAPVVTDMVDIRVAVMDLAVIRVGIISGPVGTSMAVIIKS